MDEHSGLGLPPRRDDDALVSHFRNALLDRVVSGGMAEQPTTIGGYALLSRVGEGGMGQVWRARSDQGHVVALKILRRSYAQDANCRRRFVREARAAQAVSHPGVVEIYEVGTALDDQPFIAMELIEGGTIRSIIDTDAPLPWARASAIWMQAAEALGAAHEHGIVHRDVKPSNILLKRDSAGFERCRLIDFGLVRGLAGDASTELTTIGQLVGTPSYISPEALRGELVDGRCDQYSLGGLAYELLEGTRPFRGAGIEEIFMQHLHVPPPKPALVGVQASMRAQVWAILRRSLAKHASERFRSMTELLTALQAVRPGGTAVEVRHTKPSPRTKWLWPLLFTASVATAGLLWIRDGGSAERPMPTALSSVARAPETPPVSRPVADLTTGVGLTCALSQEGEVRCWGADSKGRLGTGTHGANIGDNEHPRSAAPLVLPPDERVWRIIGGPDARHVCVLYESG
ncbi:MAG: serine/threonine protein kinase, partial [Nannocystaceae bacterium]|nr:serine/threonine protein kinase [Nannocystaceae bacterium]